MTWASAANFYCMCVYELVSLHLWFCMKDAAAMPCACASYFEWIKGGERCIYFPQLIGHNGDEVTSGSLCYVCVCVLARLAEMGDKWTANEKEQLLQYSCFRIACLAVATGRTVPRVSGQCPSYATRSAARIASTALWPVRGHSVRLTHHQKLSYESIWIMLNTVHKLI